MYGLINMLICCALTLQDNRAHVNELMLASLEEVGILQKGQI